MSARRLVQGLTLLVSAYYALWACAPAATFRPMTLDLDEPNEFGLGADASYGLGTTTACANDLVGCGTAGLNGQIWYQHRFNQRFSLGGTIFAGQTSLFGAGVQTRLHWVETDRFRFGTDFEAGFLWVGVGLPTSLRLVNDLWVYTNPSVGYRLVQPARLPIGLAWGVTDHLWLQAEFAYGFDFLTEPVDVTGSDYWTAGGAVSWRF